MKKYFCTAFIILLCVACVCSCKNEFSNQDVINMSGNTNTNLTVGGKICKEGECIYFCSPSNQKLTNCISKKTSLTDDTENLKNFFRIPSELCVVGNNLFFKLTSGSSANSFLYRTNSSGNNKKTIIKKNVSQYMVYDNHIYYTLEDKENVGIYVCDFNGKNEKKIIHSFVSEFICSNDNIFYIINDEIYKLNLATLQEKKIYKSTNVEDIHNLTINNQRLFFITEKSSNDKPNGIYSLDLTNDSVEKVYTGTCAFIHIVDNNRLIFLNNNNYCVLDLTTNQISNFLKEYTNLSELYVFQTDVYFYTTEYTSEFISEKLYYVNIAEENYEPIVLS